MTKKSSLDIFYALAIQINYNKKIYLQRSYAPIKLRPPIKLFVLNLESFCLIGWQALFSWADKQTDILEV